MLPLRCHSAANVRPNRQPVSLFLAAQSVMRKWFTDRFKLYLWWIWGTFVSVYRSERFPLFKKNYYWHSASKMFAWSKIQILNAYNIHFCLCEMPVLKCVANIKKDRSTQWRIFLSSPFNHMIHDNKVWPAGRYIVSPIFPAWPK